MLPLLLTAALLTQPAAIKERHLQVGGFVLLTSYGAFGSRSIQRTAPALTDSQGHPTSHDPWLNHPVKVVRETPFAYLLADGAARAWLPKAKLAFKSVFPLHQTPATQTLARQFGQSTVWVHGQPGFACTVAPGYHATVTLKTARVATIWAMEGEGLNLSPQGGLAQGDLSLNERVTSQALLLMLTPTSGVTFVAAELDPSLHDQSAQLMKQVGQRCTSLAGLYANRDDLHRTLSTLPLAKAPSLPNDFDAWAQALVGWTRVQVLAQYGSPNESGSLQDILKLNIWTYGGSAYDTARFSFDVHGRVSKAVISRSP